MGWAFAFGSCRSRGHHEPSGFRASGSQNIPKSKFTNFTQIHALESCDHAISRKIHAQVTFVFFGKPMEIYGNPWKSMEIYGNLSVEIYGNPWKSMEIYGNLWKSMEISGNPWKSMEIYGNLWKSMEICGNLWKFPQLVCIMAQPSTNTPPIGPPQHTSNGKWAAY